MLHASVDTLARELVTFHVPYASIKFRLELPNLHLVWLQQLAITRLAKFLRAPKRPNTEVDVP